MPHDPVKELIADIAVWIATEEGGGPVTVETLVAEFGEGDGPRPSNADDILTAITVLRVAGTAIR